MACRAPHCALLEHSSAAKYWLRPSFLTLHVQHSPPGAKSARPARTTTLLLALLRHDCKHCGQVQWSEYILPPDLTQATAFTTGHLPPLGVVGLHTNAPPLLGHLQHVNLLSVCPATTFCPGSPNDAQLVLSIHLSH